MMDEDEKTLEQELDDAINAALSLCVDVQDSRENSLVKTKLEEARSWNTLDIQRKEN